jgi:hypothetical protein
LAVALACGMGWTSRTGRCDRHPRISQKPHGTLARQNFPTLRRA